LPAAKRIAFLPPLQSAMTEFQVNTPQREAAFLAQIAHESGEFRWMEEIWGPTPAQQCYEPPSELASKLGNGQTGDGKRFKGRGPIQITGRDNYKKYGGLLEIDLVQNPDLAATADVGFRIAGLYWQNNGLNEMADRFLFETITKRINGGLNGLDDRLKYYDRAKAVLGVDESGSNAEIFEILPQAETFTRGYEEIRGSSAASSKSRKSKTSAGSKKAMPHNRD
jgi:predicted chitinase